MRSRFEDFLEILPDRLYFFLISRHIHSFFMLSQFTKEDLTRKGLSVSEIDILSQHCPIKNDEDIPHIN